MPDLLSTIAEQHINVSPGFVESLIRTQREELFTGLMHLHYPSDESLVLVFLGGNQQKLYHSLENRIDNVPRQSWPNFLSHSDASVGFMGLSVEGVRFLRVAYEAPIQDVDSANLSTNEMAGKVSHWAADPLPSLIRVRAEDINVLYLIPGNSTPVIEELTFTDGKARFALTDASFPLSLPNLNFQVTRYVSEPKHDLWQEHQLRLAFNPLMRMLFIRFSELAGRVLTERLCEQLSIWARDGGLDMTVTGNGISNQHYFDSLESASNAYLGLVRRFHYEATPAIGPRMADGISREVLLKLDHHRRSILNQHIYDKYRQQNNITMVWR